MGIKYVRRFKNHVIFHKFQTDATPKNDGFF